MRHLKLLLWSDWASTVRVASPLGEVLMPAATPKANSRSRRSNFSLGETNSYFESAMPQNQLA
ncbi:MULTISPECIES: hypothetical protein [Nostoc]|uniref:Uncharacterized protein n=1 Tax=Nostoc paludosum FACHB-159 TaxID=2692908 RepID=A0ABR8K3I6_9NOSO|nr:MULTISPECIES: hypothetical protein [Nostoc]MBD2677797.1 hypothetical protein [Nostoc sp. FACHB-857]MBD2734029.1 hypothetical protein [Nostoc paludosum FACHB-159]